MFNLLLLTTKHLMESSAEKWNKVISEKTILFTGIESKKYIDYNKKIFNTIFFKIVYFDNYHYSDLIDKEILLIGQKFKIAQIIALAEVDILRAARARERLNINGQTINSAMLYRNKTNMKKRVKKAGLLSPRFCTINNTLALMDFINQIGYPIIIKPTLGRGSANTHIIKNENELDTHLALGLFNNNHSGSELLVEEFISGEIYHIDGLIYNDQIKFINASKYINSCLDFLSGSFLGSITLSDCNYLKRALIETSKKILFNALDTPKNTLFHIELFVLNDGKIYFCEAASRLGGGNINEQLLLSYNYDIKLEFIKLFYNKNVSSQDVQKNIVSRLLIPAKPNSTLKEIPLACPFDEVKSYIVNAKVNDTFSKITMSNQEIAHFIFESNSENDALNKMKELFIWFNNNTKWIPG